MPTKKNTTDARFAQLFQPVLSAIKSLGGSARPAEVKEWIIDNVTLPADYVSAVHKGGESKFGNDVDWARFYLVRAGLIDASKRGVWSTTELGRSANVGPTEAAAIIRQTDARAEASASAESLNEGHEPHVEQVLSLIKSLPPNAFERLCQRLLRESGFEEVKVTGRSGDHGIDGHGILKVNAFVSFRLLFQCKRHKDSVGTDAIRDFRGAMVGRAEKGLVLTTGYFTPQAEAEASRDGAQPIELVDGEQLVKLLGELELGLSPKITYEVHPDFFKQFV
jgi:restriction system protein